MALTDEGGNNGMIMPVAPMYGGGYGNGCGFGGDWCSWLIVLIVFGMMFGGGFGGFGGYGGGMMNFDFPRSNESAFRYSDQPYKRLRKCGSCSM